MFKRLGTVPYINKISIICNFVYSDGFTILLGPLKCKANVESGVFLYRLLIPWLYEKKIWFARQVFLPIRVKKITVVMLRLTEIFLPQSGKDKIFSPNC